MDGATCAVVFAGLTSGLCPATGYYTCICVFSRKKKNEQKALRFGELAVASVARRSEPTAAIAQDLDYIYIDRY